MSLLLSKKKKRKVILFLCTGNTCRGPMAQGYMRKALEDKLLKDFDVKTAGVMTIPGLIPTPEATQVMRNAGIDITQHRSSPLTPELIRKCDLILGMTPFHVQFALRMSDDAKGKTYLLKEYAESDMKNYQITDPMGATLEVYKRVYREMKLAIDKMIETREFFTGISVEDAKKARKPVAAAPAKPAATKPVKSSKPTKDATPGNGAGAAAKAAPPKVVPSRPATGAKPSMPPPSVDAKRKKTVAAK